MADDTRIWERFDAFCKEYDIPEKHHGSWIMLASMAYVLGFEIEVRRRSREEEEKNDD